VPRPRTPVPSRVCLPAIPIPGRVLFSLVVVLVVVLPVVGFLCCLYRYQVVVAGAKFMGYLGVGVGRDGNRGRRVSRHPSAVSYV
jgi:hypothetical protein